MHAARRVTPPNVTSLFSELRASLVERQVYRIPNLILIPTMPYNSLILFILAAVTANVFAATAEEWRGRSIYQVPFVYSSSRPFFSNQS